MMWVVRACREGANFHMFAIRSSCLRRPHEYRPHVCVDVTCVRVPAGAVLSCSRVHFLSPVHYYHLDDDWISAMVRL